MTKIKLSIVLIVGVLLFSPFFVVAKTCYVDIDGDNGDGSKDNPYKTITKALSEDCDNVKVEKGRYKETIVLGEGVKLEGVGKETIVDGRVKMKNKSSLEDVYVDNWGVEVLDNASVSIKSVRIEGTHIGIATTGSGKLTVKNCKIQHNGKGLYLRYGKDIDLRDNEIVNNEEEGVDIRANVDGVIEGNVIESNKEGGIEVVIGKSELQIVNNSIKHNKASGIALQFYKENDKLGNIIIKGNKLIGNGSYGVDCKRPSGGHTQSQYWSKSVNFGYNLISGNGKGVLSERCKFTDDKLEEATLTAKEIEERKKKAEEDNQKKKDEEEKLKQAELERKRAEELRRQKEEEDRKREAMTREALWKKDEILKKHTENIGQCSLSDNDLSVLRKKNRLKIFLMGPDEEVIEKYKNKEYQCAEVIKKIESEINNIQVKEVKEEMENNYLSKLKKQLNVMIVEGEKYQNRFGLWRWIKGLFGR